MATCHRHYSYLILLLCPLTQLFGHNHGGYSHQKGENSSKPDNKGNYFMHTESCQHDHDHSHPHEQPDGSQRDLVCGMTVPPDSRYFELYEGKTYRFCSEKCLTKFRAAPVHYLSPPRTKNTRAISTRLPRSQATRRTPNTLARCIPKSASVGRAVAQSVAWP